MQSKQAVFLVAGLVAVVVGAWLGASGESTVDPEISTPIGTSSEVFPGLVVHVSGWVVAPGVVTIPEGSIVADAVGAAGGAKPGAALDRINLSRLVLDGELIEVPGPNSTEPAGGTNEDGLISLNRATASELESLPGVGQVLAERIVAFRDANGSFSTVEDLLDVSGIGEAKLASIRDLVTVP